MTTTYATLKHRLLALTTRLDRTTIIFSCFIFSLIFSYQPLIHFGSVSGINLKLSLPIVVATILISLSLPRIYTKRRELYAQTGTKLFLLFCLINSASVLWSDNITRALFETGFLWLLFFMFVSTIVSFQKLYQNRHILYAALSASALLACLFAWWQIFGEAFGMPSSYTLLPIAYQSAVFGFARPTGFALEPQFLGSLLAIPIMTSSYFLLKGRRNLIFKMILLVGFATLVATISRGALLATTVGLIILFIFVRISLRNHLKVLGILCASLLISLSLVTAAAQINSRDAIDGRAAAIGTIDQVSLGTINLNNPAPQSKSPDTTPSTPTNPSTATPSTSPTSPAYVAESTNSRLLMSQQAVSLWTTNVYTFLFGIGVGGFGAAINTRDDSFALNSIVNNEYLQIAAELGLVGLLVFVALLLLPLYRLIKSKSWLFVSLLSVIYLQWLFFSGHINAMHVWVVIALAYAVYRLKTSPKKATKPLL